MCGCVYNIAAERPAGRAAATNVEITCCLRVRILILNIVAVAGDRRSGVGHPRVGGQNVLIGCDTAELCGIGRGVCGKGFYRIRGAPDELPGRKRGNSRLTGEAHMDLHVPVCSGKYQAEIELNRKDAVCDRHTISRDGRAYLVAAGKHIEEREFKIVIAVCCSPAILEATLVTKLGRLPRDRTDNENKHR